PAAPPPDTSYPVRCACHAPHPVLLVFCWRSSHRLTNCQSKQRPTNCGTSCSSIVAPNAFVIDVLHALQMQVSPNGQHFAHRPQTLGSIRTTSSAVPKVFT